MAPVDAEPGVVRIDVASPEDVLDGHGFTVPRTLTGTALGSLTGLVAESLPGERVAASGCRICRSDAWTSTPGTPGAAGDGPQTGLDARL